MYLHSFVWESAHCCRHMHPHECNFFPHTLNPWFPWHTLADLYITPPDRLLFHPLPQKPPHKYIHFNSNISHSEGAIQKAFPCICVPCISSAQKWAHWHWQIIYLLVSFVCCCFSPFFLIVLLRCNAVHAFFICCCLHSKCNSMTDSSDTYCPYYSYTHQHIFILHVIQAKIRRTERQSVKKAYTSIMFSIVYNAIMWYRICVGLFLLRMTYVYMLVVRIYSKMLTMKNQIPFRTNR